jgi:hypothetical protein
MKRKLLSPPNYWCPEKSAPYSNLLIKDVTSKFIQLTHEAYYQTLHSKKIYSWR